MSRPFSVVDLFSGAGGMSYGFHQHPGFRLLAAADAELGKPSAGHGRLQCNGTYERNMGIRPVPMDLADIPPERLRVALDLHDASPVHVLSACPPCTGFSRANPENHLRDDTRNSLVRRSAAFALALDADVVVMENARELLSGNFRHHYEAFEHLLRQHGYHVEGRVYMLTRFGLPQVRERAIVIAAKRPLPIHTLGELWDGHIVKEDAVTVRRSFASIPPGTEGSGLFPGFGSDRVRRRMEAIPRNGGSWVDLLKRPDADTLLTPAMKRIVARHRLGSYPDVYGRMAWDAPAPTIKRECSHVGNGRYAHPEETRLCSVREMASLQGFPHAFEFGEAALSNLYRHIGDAVPPLVSFQLAHVVFWILTGERPPLEKTILEGTNLNRDDIGSKRQKELLHA